MEKVSLYILVFFILSCLIWNCDTFAEEIPDGQIAYLSGEDIDTYHVHILELQSKTEKTISKGSHHGAPVWSPDGKSIAFSAKSDKGLSIFIYNNETDECHVINHKFPWNDSPSWSANSKYIAYTSCEKGLIDQKVTVYELENDKEEFWGGEKVPSILTPVWFPKLDILNAMNATVSQVTYSEGFDIHKFFDEGYSTGVLIGVAVFPLESKRLTTELVVFSKSQATPLPKELMLESSRFEELNPQVSPKGSSLVFETNESGDREIYYLGRKGISNISNHHSADWNPVWSPNGEWVAFESFRQGRRGIYRVFPETARVFPFVASADFDCWNPTWSPNSEWICFVSNQTGTPQLYLKNIMDDKIIPLTSSAVNVAPCWRPKAK